MIAYEPASSLVGAAGAAGKGKGDYGDPASALQLPWPSGVPPGTGLSSTCTIKAKTHHVGALTIFRLADRGAGVAAALAAVSAKTADTARISVAMRRDCRGMPR